MSKIGRFGEFGGQYIPETVMTAVHELEKAYDKYKDDPEFNKELQELYQLCRQTVNALLCRKDDQRSWRS